MTRPELTRTLADIVLIAHFAFVAFVIGGLLLIVLGGFCRWSWIRNPWFRSLHLAAIALVVLQSWLGMICPLTTWEMELRDSAGDATYSGTFIGHWLQRLLYYEAPPWTFVLCYTAFGVLVAGTWIRFRPRSFRRTQINPT